MRNLVAIVALISLAALTVAPSTADEPPHLALVQKLRARGEPDLALKYLIEVLKEHPPEELKALIPLEIAKTRLDIANLSPDSTRRKELFDQARGEFEAFIRDNPEHPLAANANLEIARIISLEGGALLSVARRQETTEGQKREAKNALKKFAEAAPRLQSAAKQIEDRLGKLPSPPKTAQDRAAHQALTEAGIQAEFAQGMNFIDQARAYKMLGEGENRGKSIEKARELMKNVAGRDTKNPLCWQARAWLGRTYQATENYDEARKEYEGIVNATGEQTDTAKRMAAFELMEMAKAGSTPDKKLPGGEVVRRGEDWLKRYSGYQDTAEGYGVRYELALAYYIQAKAVQSTAKTPTTASMGLYSRAEKLAKPVAEVESDYQLRAQQLLNELIVSTGAIRAAGSIDAYKTFDDCIVRARYEQNRLFLDDQKVEKDRKNLKGDKELKAFDLKVKANRKKHEDDIIKALNKAIQLSRTTAVKPEDQADARYTLAYVYLINGDLYKAAVMGEHVGRTFPGNGKAALGVGCALDAYSRILFKEEADLEQEAKDNPKGERAIQLTRTVETDRGQMRRLAEFAVKSFKTPEVVDMAQHQIGMLLLREKKYQEAVDALARVSASYAQAARARYQLAYATLELDKNDQLTPAQKKAFRDRAVAALQGVPDVGPRADADTADAYLRGKLLLIQWLYPEKKYDEMEKQAGALQKKIESMRLDEESKSAFLSTAAAMILAAKQGSAYEALLHGEFARARELTDPAVEEIKKGGVADPRFADLRRSLVLLNLRANVQEQNLDRAQELLALLQKNDKGENSGADVLVQLGIDLKSQIDDLKRKGKPAEEQLSNTKARFLAFLDVLAKQKALAPRTVHFLVNSYSSLDNHEAALALLDKHKVTEPKEPDELPPGDQLVEAKMEAWKQQVQQYKEKLAYYHIFEILRVREMRLAVKSLPVEERDKAYDKALKAIGEILTTKWGKTSIEALQERAHLLQDWEKYKQAASGYDDIMKKLKPYLDKDNHRKEQYYDCLYQLIVCIYKNAAKLPEKGKQRQLTTAAKSIVQVEGANPPFGSDGLRKRYEDLLADAPELKKIYKDENGKLLLSAEDVVVPVRPEEAPPETTEVKAEEKKPDAPAGFAATSKNSLLLFIGLVILGLGAVGFAFFKWIRS